MPAERPAAAPPAPLFAAELVLAPPKAAAAVLVSAQGRGDGLHCIRAAAAGVLDFAPQPINPVNRPQGNPAAQGRAASMAGRPSMCVCPSPPAPWSR
jgi:hypothetical protein